jgi:hypothetical protein
MQYPAKNIIYRQKCQVIKNIIYRKMLSNQNNYPLNHACSYQKKLSINIHPFEIGIGIIETKSYKVKDTIFFNDNNTFDFYTH